MDAKYANRVSVLLSNIKPGEVLILGKNGVTTSYEVLEKDAIRGAQGHTILTLKNISTGDISKFNKKEYLQTATCATDSIGYRKARAHTLVTTPATAPVAPPAPVAPAIEATSVEVIREPAQALPEPPAASAPSLNAKFSEIGVNAQKELEEVYKLFEKGDDDAAIERLLN